MSDNFDLKGFLRNNKLLNEGIGGYFDLKPLKEDFQDFIERVHQELTPEESAWLVDNVDALKAKFPKQFAKLEGDVEGMTALVKQLYFEKDADSEMNEAEDSFVLAQRDAENYDRLLDLGGDQIEKGIISLVQDGFDVEDILDFVKTVLEDNANTGD